MLWLLGVRSVQLVSTVSVTILVYFAAQRVTIVLTEQGITGKAALQEHSVMKMAFIMLLVRFVYLFSTTLTITLSLFHMHTHVALSKHPHQTVLCVFGCRCVEVHYFYFSFHF